MLNPTHKLWLTITLKEPLGWAGGAALAALKLDNVDNLISLREPEKIKALFADVYGT